MRKFNQIKIITLNNISILFFTMLFISQGYAQKIEHLEKGGIGIDGLVNISFPTPNEVLNAYAENCSNLQTIDSIGFPVMCQQAGAMIFNKGRDKIIKIGLRSIISSSIDPFGLLGDSDNLKKRIAVGTGLMIIGATMIATCPPISVNEGFHDLSRVEKLSQAQAFGYVPDAPPNFDLDVDAVGDPQSCTATLNVSINNNTKEVTDFGNFNAREFAYASPFGSYPSAALDIAHLTAEFVSCTATIVSLVDISVGPSISTDFIDAPEIPDVNLSGILGGLVDLIIDNIGFDNFEGVALSNFNSWKNNYRNQNPVYCTDNTCGFEHGFNRMAFYENMSASVWGNVTPKVEYYQDINVMEYFDPEITALPLEVHLEALEIGGVTVSAYPPRSFTGTPPSNKNYTFDYSWLGVEDNCDSSPTLEFPVAPFYPLGNWDIPITVTDRVGNVTTSSMRIVVEDSIPPDLLPLDAVGIPVADGTTVINFDDPGIGCVENLCEGFPSTKYLHPPVYFDFASISPDVECYVDNVLDVDLVPCLVAQLPVNDVSLITWSIADPSGNVTEIVQEVFVRENSFNQVPTVTDINVTIGQNTQVQIPLSGNDADYDPLDFNIIAQSSNGNLDAQVEPIFQTRFTTSGMIRSASSMINVFNDYGERGLLLAVPDEKRLYLYSGDLNSLGGEVVQRYDFSSIVPSAIAFTETKNVNLGSTSMNKMLESANNPIWVGDWVNRKVYRYTYNNSTGIGVEKLIFNIPASIQQPSGLAVTNEYGKFQLLITDKQNNKLMMVVVERLTYNSNLANQTYSYQGVTSIRTLPFTVDAMDNWTSYGNILIASWSTKQLLLLNWTTGTSESWDISALIDDPDGANNPGLPIMQDPIDFVLIDDSSTQMKIRLFDQAELKYVEKQFIKSNHTVICSGGGTGIPPIYCTNPEQDVFRLPAMVDILAIEEHNNLIYVLDNDSYGNQHLYRFDLAGRLDAVISLYSNAPSPSSLSTTSNTSFVDIALMDNGDLLLMEKGGSNNTPSIHQVTVNSGVDEYFQVRTFTVDMNTSAYTIALDVNATDIAVLLSKGFVNIPLNNIFNQTQYGPYATADIHSDVALSDAGDFYAGTVKQNGSSPLYHLVRFTFSQFGIYFGYNDNDVNLDFNADMNYGSLYFDNAKNKIWVSDFPELFYPDLGASGEIHRMPRVSAYAPDGTLLERLIPDGDPNDFFSFLEPGDFGTITSIAAGPNRLYVAESVPLKRLHVFDTSEFMPVTCTNLPEGEVCQEIGYTPDNGFTGTEIFTYGASDPFNANSNTATVTITVINDQQSPILTCPSAISLEKNDNTGFVADLDEPEKERNTIMRDFLLGVLVSENTDLPVVEASHNIPVALPMGVTTVTYSATDGSNNTGNCQTAITVVDTTAPTITAVATLTVEATALLTPKIDIGLIEPNTSDFSAYILTSDAPNEFPVGETTVTWYASDSQGNQSQQKQLVIVQDTTAPVFIVGAPPVDLVGSTVQQAITYLAPQATDAVGVNNAGIVCLPAIGDMVSMGPTLVQCNVSDGFGNKANTSFTVNYYDVDANFDGIINVLDQGSSQFSDAANGGQTSGQITSFGNYVLKVYEAPPNEGVTVGLKEAFITRGVLLPAMTNVCNNKLAINNLNQETILFDDISVSVFDHVVVTCQTNGYKIFSLLGNNDFTMILPDNSVATSTMEFNNGLIIDGWIATALSDNRGEIIISTSNEDYHLLLGQSVDLSLGDLIFANGF